jgi:LPS-assembly protein
MDNGFKSRLTAAAGAEIRWPWSRRSDRSVQIIEPVVQLVYTPDPLISGTIPNEDSQQFEFDTSNLFAFDRFAGEDLVETGFRANVGLNYTRIDPDGWSLGLIVGQVFRTSDNGQFSPDSGLDGTSSDIVASAILDLPPYLRLSNRVMFDNDFSVRRNEAQFALNRARSGVSGTYAFLSADTGVNAFPQRHEIYLSGRHELTENWRITADWRHDIESNSTISYGGTLTYGNECIEVDLSAERSFTSSLGVPPTDSFSLTIQLASFGGTNDSAKPKRNCPFR